MEKCMWRVNAHFGNGVWAAEERRRVSPMKHSSKPETGQGERLRGIPPRYAVDLSVTALEAQVRSTLMMEVEGWRRDLLVGELVRGMKKGGQSEGRERAEEPGQKQRGGKSPVRRRAVEPRQRRG